MAKTTDSFNPTKFKDAIVWEDDGGVTIDPLNHIQKTVAAALETARLEADEIMGRAFNVSAARITHDALQNSSVWLDGRDGDVFLELYIEGHDPRRVSLDQMIRDLIENQWGTKEQIESILSAISGR